MSNRGVIVTIPTVTATMNAYLFLKTQSLGLYQKCLQRDNKRTQNNL